MNSELIMLRASLEKKGFQQIDHLFSSLDQLGLQLQAKTVKPPDSSGEEQQALQQLFENSSPSLPELQFFWKKNRNHQKLEAENYLKLIQSAKSNGATLLWIDMAKKGLHHHPEHLKIIHFLALGYAHTGDFYTAYPIARQGLKQSRTTEDIENFHTLLGRLHKDRFLEHRKHPSAAEQLEKAIHHYQQAYQLGNKFYYPAINLATLLSITEQYEDAEKMATVVLKQCQQKSDFWQASSYATALLILGEKEHALQSFQTAYKEATQHATRLHDKGSTRKTARLLLKHLYQDPTSFDECVDIETITLFTGHMLDSINRKNPRFPKEQIPFYQEQLAAALQKNHTAILVSSLANGADMIITEEAQKKGIQTHAILPFPARDFVKASVKNSSFSNEFNQELERTFYKLLEQSDSVHTLNKNTPSNDDLLYAYANNVMLGIAKLKAKHIGLPLNVITLWNGDTGGGMGGTEDFLNQFHNLQISNVYKNLQQTTCRPQQQNRNFQKNKNSSLLGVKGVLFADVKHFSKLNDCDMPNFIKHYMGAVGDLMQRSAFAPVFSNTWGDGICMVFDSIASTGFFALELRDTLQNAALLKEAQLPSELSIRIAVHAGPAYQIKDPIINQHSFVGSHITYAARMEPITEPSQVFASDSFAALAILEPAASFQCRYVGEHQAPKGFGEMTLYRLDY